MPTANYTPYTFEDMPSWNIYKEQPSHLYNVFQQRIAQALGQSQGAAPGAQGNMETQPNQWQSQGADSER